MLSNYQILKEMLNKETMNTSVYVC